MDCAAMNGIVRCIVSSDVQYSIIIPTYNRMVQLRRTLHSIATAVRSSDPVEILVIDNGSIDKTSRVVDEVRERFARHCWRYIHDGMPGLLSGRHRGAKEARGKILAYLDDDVVVSPTWLEGLNEAFRDPKVVLVGGPSLPEYEVVPPPWLEDLWWQFGGDRLCGSLSLLDLGAAAKPVDPCLVWGLNFSIRKEVLYACGGFHPDCIPASLQRYQGDGETGLSLKIREKGLLALYHPAVALKHVIPGSRLTAQAFARRAFYQGVSDSYTRIRRECAVPTVWTSWKEGLRPIKNKLHDAYRLWKGETSVTRSRPITAEGKTVRNVLMARAYMNGIAFHQSEVRNDATLFDWVIRSNYFDYNLPRGWKEYGTLVSHATCCHPPSSSVLP
jgi:glycosyltransferase involved in cell wall biosynthesis